MLRYANLHWALDHNPPHLLVNSGLSLQRSCLVSTLTQNQIRNSEKVDVTTLAIREVAHST